jgi:hypothetical protein
MAFENLRAEVINASTYTFRRDTDGRHYIEFDGVEGKFYLIGDSVNFVNKEIKQRAFYYSEKTNGEKTIFLINPYN